MDTFQGFACKVAHVDILQIAQEIPNLVISLEFAWNLLYIYLFIELMFHEITSFQVSGKCLEYL